MKNIIGEFIKGCYCRRFSHVAYGYLFFKVYKHNIRKNRITFKDINLNDNKKLWGPFISTFDTYSFKYYSNYISHHQDIVPEALGRTCLEPVLNPIKYRTYYADKNMFPKILGEKNVAPTIICRINGGMLLNKDFMPISSPVSSILLDFDKVILKPTVESKGGAGILLFMRDGKDMRCGDVILTEDFLMKYANDFVLQEAIKQHDSLAQLNHSSVNTLRLAVYRSVNDDKPHVLASVIRIGGEGMYVDNARSGGKYAAVDIHTGKIANTLRDSSGQIYNSQNGIDFSKLDFTIPGWQLIKEKCIEFADKIPHHRLIAFDMTITNNLTPVLIEFNVESFSYRLYMYTNQAPLGPYTKEIVDYCLHRL